MSYWSSEFTPFDGSRHAAPVPVRDALIALIVGLIVVAVTWMTVAFVDTSPQESPCDALSSVTIAPPSGTVENDKQPCDGGAGSGGTSP